MHLFPKTSVTPPQLSRRLLLCAVSAWSLDSSAAPPSVHALPSTPYLLVCLPPALRFEPPVTTLAPVPLDPVPAGPPHPSGLFEEIASTNHEAAVAIVPSPHAPSPAPVPTAPASPNAAAPSPAPNATPTTPAPSPADAEAILPDDTPRQIRPQDVLLYFNFPYNQPSSSATYRQQ